MLKILIIDLKLKLIPMDRYERLKLIQQKIKIKGMKKCTSR